VEKKGTTGKATEENIIGHGKDAICMPDNEGKIYRHI
jgi:hypothetical protein